MIDLQLYGCNGINLNLELFHFHIIMRNVPVSLLFSTHSYCYCSIASDVVRHFLLNHHHHLSRAIFLPHFFMMFIFIYPFACFCFWFNSPCVFITSKNKHKPTYTHKHTLFVLFSSSSIVSWFTRIVYVLGMWSEKCVRVTDSRSATEHSDSILHTEEMLLTQTPRTDMICTSIFVDCCF